MLFKLFDGSWPPFSVLIYVDLNIECATKVGKRFPQVKTNPISGEYEYKE